jgi:NAD(P) transhydrogenase subunit beta
MEGRVLDYPLVITATYLISAGLLILGLKLMGSPATARRGNQLASIGLLSAVGVTLLDRSILDFKTIVAGVVLGTVIGGVFARTVKMTAMPQMVALFNGFGGAASALIAISEFVRFSDDRSLELPLDTSVTIMLGTLIGLVTLTGSFIAFGKLQEIVSTRSVTYPLQKTISAILFIGIVTASGYLVAVGPEPPIFLGLVAMCLLLGVLLVLPIGGADMPVVISLLNSYSGLAAAAAGFVLDNTILIIGGALVGAAGLILTQIMTRAMHRSLVNVIFGSFGAQAGSGAAGAIRSRADVRDGDADDVAIMLAYAQSVIIVPGYGLAVAQAQHQVRELASMLEARGTNVRYAIHPVAGRMPGHMNVLLAEADVPYDKLFDLDDINDDFERTDVAIVIGANDVTNPAARDAADSPIYGMPILNVDRASQVVVMKRSLSPGFAGIDNELFYRENTTMLFDDAKAGVAKLIVAVSEV